MLPGLLRDVTEDEVRLYEKDGVVYLSAILSADWVHHSNLIHGSGPNYRDDRTRRAVSFRYAGDRVRYLHHRSAPPQPHHLHSLRDGDPLDSDQFPVVWCSA